MKLKNLSLSGSRFVPIKIVLPYALITFLWIEYSNSLLIFLFRNHEVLRWAMEIKGSFYAIVSSIILYALFRAATVNLRQSERKYRHLFDNAAVSIWEEDFSAVKQFFDHQRALGVVDWKAYFDSNPQSVKKCAGLVKIIDFNQEGLRFLNVKSKDLVPRTLDNYFSEESYESFKQQLIAMAQGTTEWSSEISTRSLKEDGQKILYKMVVVPGYEEDFSKVLVSLLDITESKKIEAVLQHKEQRLRQIIDLVPHYIFAKDIKGHFILANQAIADAYGTTVQDLVGKTDADFIASTQQVQHFLQDDQEVIRSGKPKFIPLEPITNVNGEVRFLSTTKIPFTASGTNVPCVLGVAVDITDYKKAQEALVQSRHFIDSILDSTPNLIYLYDVIEKCNVYSNRETTEFLGYSPQQLQEMGSKLFNRVLHPEDFAKVMEHYRLLADGGVREIEYRMQDVNGQWRWLRSRDVLFSRTPSGEPWQILGTAEDITEQKFLESKFLTLSYYDAVTSFPNRTLFFERANLGLSHAKRTNTACAILFIDLDDFKIINDTLGHSVGDVLLKDTAVKLAECIREVDTVARLGGDKFIVFLNGLEDAQSAQHIAERIREKFNAPRLVAGNDLFVTASIGIATFPNDGNNLEDLLKNADTAMSVAKEVGRNAFCFFDGTMNERAVTRMKLERGLREALVKGELRLFYQPIIGVANGEVRGFEALLRWFKQDGTMIYPGDFICIAEETGLIISIGEWVLKEACRMGKKLKDLGFEGTIMSVNVSVAQLRSRGIVYSIKNALEESGLPPQCLEVEITESIFIESFEATVGILKEIRQMGVNIALDDFGTGYSSLSHLQRLPITTLKIDRLFIKELMEDGVQLAMTSTIIGLAHTLNLGVIAEGVEHDLQLRNLAREDCDYFQGFLFGKPMPEEQAVAFLRENMLS